MTYLLRFVAVIEADGREGSVYIRQQQSDDVDERRPQRVLVLPTAPHQLVQLLRAVVRLLHDPAVYYVPQHLVITEPLYHKHTLVFPSSHLYEFFKQIYLDMYTTQTLGK